MLRTGAIRLRLIGFSERAYSALQRRIYQGVDVTVLRRTAGAEGQGKQRTVFLIHQGLIQHYRVGVYNFLSEYLQDRGWQLAVVSGGVEPHCQVVVDFDFRPSTMRLTSIWKLIRMEKPSAVILFLNLRQLFLFPLILLLKAHHIPAIYWGHAIDLEDKGNRLKRLIYAIEHSLVDALILYSDSLRVFVATRHQEKVFVANNTLNITSLVRRNPDRGALFRSYGVFTSRNVICVGRLQRRKGIPNLLAAFERIANEDFGLILIGPDVDGVMEKTLPPRVFWLGALYGDQVQNLMECADVYCMPGHVGLSIVDAFFFGLPFVTTDVDHAPEIAYLKHDVNGLILPKGDDVKLALCLERLLLDDAYRQRLSVAAESTIKKEASITLMCRGFSEALSYVSQGSE